MTELLNASIQTDFETLNDVGTGVHIGAQRALEFENDTFRASVTNTLTEINVQVDDIVARVDKLV
jgi:hypothetical protein